MKDRRNKKVEKYEILNKQKPMTNNSPFLVFIKLVTFIAHMLTAFVKFIHRYFLSSNTKYYCHSYLSFMRIVITLFIFTIWQSTLAGINEDLNAFYNSLGYDSNFTTAGAYHSQEAGYYAAGSNVLRSRVRNLQVIHLDAPSLKMGCGGIDMFFGGFSYINSEQLTRFLRQVMNNATGYAFNLALETMVPEIAHAMQYMQDQAQKINNLNFSSCETAEALVGGLWPKTRANHQQVCQDLGTNTNYFADWAKARQGCGNGGEQDAVLVNAAKNPQYEPRMLINKNIVWDAIKKSGFLASDNDTAMLLMNITGSVVYDAKGAQRSIPQRLNDSIVKVLLDGGEANISVCDETEKCLTIHEGNITVDKVKGLRSQVIKTINDIVVGTKNNTSITSKEIGFINSVSIPIVKFVNISLATKNEAHALSLTNYADAIAKDILKKYLVELLTLTRQGLRMTSDYDPAIYDRFDKDVASALIFIENIKTESHHDTQDLMSLVGSIRKLEKEITSKTSEQLKKRLGGGS